MKSKKIQLAMYRDGKYWFVNCEALRIYACGESPTEALVDFSQHLSYFTEEFIKTPDSKLDKLALKLKKTYTKFFGTSK